MSRLTPGASIQNPADAAEAVVLISPGGAPLGSPTSPLPVAAVGSPAAKTDRSGAIAAGGTAQTLMAANAGRRGFWVQNLSGDALYINGLGDAAAGQPSLRIPAGAIYEEPASGVSTTAISIFGAAAGQAFSAREW